MSSPPVTTRRRSLLEAETDAEAFKALFSSSVYEQWVIAGSVRRRAPHIGDVEHVIIPRFGAPQGALFAQEESSNRLWDAIDVLVAAGKLRQAIYTDGRTRWGPKYRGATFRGFTHEIFTADAENFGAILAIRTGPAAFSRDLVMRLDKQGFKQRDGYVFDHEEQRVSVPTEAEYFRLCAMRLIPPDRRDG